MSDYYEHLEAAWNDLSKEDKEKFISSNIRQQQPIPQDINKWIRDEAEKRFPNAPKRFKDNWISGAQLLLPQLQQLKKERDILIGNDLRQEKLIEQQKETIEELKKDNDVLTKGFDELEIRYFKKAAEIESLKQENGELKELLMDIDKSLYLGKDLDDTEILKWYIDVVSTIKESISETLKQ